MFQVAPAASWLGTLNPSDYPAYDLVQWIRLSQATAKHCWTAGRLLA
jgi:hypothetical protein